MFEEEYQEKTFGQHIEELIDKEVNKRLSTKTKQIEKDNDYFRDEMWSTKRDLSEANNRLNNLDKELEKKLKDAVKIAQREYWFNCAVGDKVYIVETNHKRKKCDRCGGTEKIPVEIDGIKVNAECPNCGTYEKRKKFDYYYFSIVEGVVERLQIEMTEKHKWIRVWINDCKYELEYNRIYRTREEAEEKLKLLESESK